MFKHQKRYPQADLQNPKKTAEKGHRLGFIGAFDLRVDHRWQNRQQLRASLLRAFESKPDSAIDWEVPARKEHQYYRFDELLRRRRAFILPETLLIFPARGNHLLSVCLLIFCILLFDYVPSTGYSMTLVLVLKVRTSLINV